MIQHLSVRRFLTGAVKGAFALCFHAAAYISDTGWSAGAFLRRKKQNARMNIRKNQGGTTHERT